MLSALTTSLLPESIGSLFDPPLDSRSLHLSLATGNLQLTNIKLNADRCTQMLLPPPASPLRVLSGEVRELSLGVDWRNLFSQPLRLVLSGLHLRLAPAPVGRLRKGVDSGGEGAEVSRTATGEVEWSEEDLMRVAVERKLLALEAAAPLLEGEEARAAAAAAGYGPDSASGGSSSTSSSWLKKLITLVLNSLHAEISDVSIVIEGEGGGVQAAEAWAAHPKMTAADEQRSLLPLATPTTAAQVRAAHAAPVKIGIELKECLLKEAVKMDRPVADYAYNATKLLQLAAAVYCDVEGAAEERSPVAAKELVEPKEEEEEVVEFESEYKGGGGRNTRGREPMHPAETKTAEARPSAVAKEWPLTHAAQPAHDYLIEPLHCDMFFAFNNDIGAKLELQSRLILPLLHLGAHPAQVAAISALLASVLRHQTTVQREVDKVADARFRSPTEEEHNRYMSVIDKAMRGQKPDAQRQRTQQQLERVLTLKDLAVMRHVVRSRLHEKQLYDEQLQAEAEERKQQWSAETSKGGGQTFETEQQEPEVGMWASLSSFFSDLVSSGEEEQKTAPVPEQKAAGGGAVHVGGVGKLQSALEEATPFDLDVQIECVAESVCVVLFEDVRRSEEAALLALSLHDGALCVDTDPGGAVNLRAGVRQLSFIDATRPQDRLPSTYMRMVPTAAADEISLIKPEAPKAGSPFELLPKEFYRAMPFFVSGRLLPTVEAVSEERKLQTKSPSLAEEEAKTAEHLNEVELAMSGVQAQLLLTLATKLARVPAVLQACTAPLSALPPAPQPPTDPELQPQGMSISDLLAALLPMRFRLNVGGGRMLPYLGEEPPPEEVAKAPLAPSSPLLAEGAGGGAAAAVGVVPVAAAGLRPQVNVAVQTSPAPIAAAAAEPEDQGLCASCMTWCTIQ